jgi:toxin ParE1/3/4
MIYSLHPEAENDLREAAEFYRVQADESLAQSFLSAFEHSVNLLLKYPRVGAAWRGKRRYLMIRFPYSLIYTVAGEEIRILAVAHQSRRPGYWRLRK